MSFFNLLTQGYEGENGLNGVDGEQVWKLWCTSNIQWVIKGQYIYIMQTKIKISIVAASTFHISYFCGSDAFLFHCLYFSGCNWSSGKRRRARRSRKPSKIRYTYYSLNVSSMIQSLFSALISFISLIHSYVLSSLCPNHRVQEVSEEALEPQDKEAWEEIRLVGFSCTSKS